MTDFCLVTLDRLIEIDSLHVQKPYNYAYQYTISIHNLTPFTLQILSRKWIIRDGDMKDRIVEGAGVVGEFPIIKAREVFTYNSYMLMQSRFGSALGFYYGNFSYDDDPDGEYNDDNVFFIRGEYFEAVIPEFQLIHRD